MAMGNVYQCPKCRGPAFGCVLDRPCSTCEPANLFRVIVGQEPPSDRYQVRFWSTTEQYARFVKNCEERGIKISHALNSLMEAFSVSVEKCRPVEIEAGRNLKEQGKDGG